MRLAPSGGNGRALAIEQISLHALTWLVVGNAVGLLLAVLLLVPGLGRLFGPATYGRWVPLHLDLQLYGWLSLPLVAALVRGFCPPGARMRWLWLACGSWSASLLFGAGSTLTGHSSGKPYLEWMGLARVLFAASLVVLWLVLLAGWLQRAASERPVARVLKSALLAALAGIPPLMYWAAGPAVKPPINPDSGGPTGASLLGSTLGVVAVVLLAPLLCGLRPRGGWSVTIQTVALLAAHGCFFAALGHGDRSHRGPE